MSAFVRNVQVSPIDLSRNDTSLNAVITFSTAIDSTTFNSTALALSPDYIASTLQNSFSSGDGITWTGKITRNNTYMNRVDNYFSASLNNYLVNTKFDVLTGNNTRTNSLPITATITVPISNEWYDKIAINSTGTTIAVTSRRNENAPTQTNFINGIRVYNLVNGNWTQIGPMFGSWSATFSTSNLPSRVQVSNDGLTVLVSFNWAYTVSKTSLYIYSGGSWNENIIYVRYNFGNHAEVNSGMSDDGSVIFSTRFVNPSDNFSSIQIYSYSNGTATATQTISPPSEVTGDRLYFGDNAVISLDGKCIATWVNNRIFIYKNVSSIWTNVLNIPKVSSVFYSSLIKLQISATGSTVAIGFPFNSNGYARGSITIYNIFPDNSYNEVGNVITNGNDSMAVGREFVLSSDSKYILTYFTENSNQFPSLRIFQCINNVWTSIFKGSNQNIVGYNFTMSTNMKKIAMINGASVWNDNTSNFSVCDVKSAITKNVVNTIALSPANITQTSLNFSLRLNTNVLSTADISNNLSLTPNNVATISDISTNDYGFTWNGKVTVNDGVNYSSGVQLKYLEVGTDVSSQSTFNIDLVVLDISSVIITPVNYLSVSSANMSIEFTKPTSLTKNQITFSPSDVSFTNLSYNASTYTYTSILTFPTSSTNVSRNYTASILHSLDISRNIAFQTNTYIPRVGSFSNLVINYRDTSGTVLLTFDKPLLVDLSLNDFSNIDPSLTLLSLTKVSSTEYNVNIGLLGTSRYTAVKTFRCDYFGVFSIINVSVNTTLPVLTSMSLSSNRLFYDSSISTISVEFSKPLHSSDMFTLADNFNYNLSSPNQFPIIFSNLSSAEDNRQSWSTNITTSDMTVSRSHNNTVSVSYNGTTLTRSFSVNTAMLANSNICFPAGEMVLTDRGYKPIEMIKEGVDTIYGRAIQHVTVTVTKDNTITLMQRHCLMKGMPNKDTYISNNHKVLYKCKMVRAHELEIDGVFQVNYTGEPLYNILLEGGDGKMVVNGMIVETLSHENNIAKLYDTLKSVQNKNIKNLVIGMYNKTYYSSSSSSSSKAK
jgi:hypothetical protein